MQQQSVVAWDEPVELFYDALIFHFVLVLSEDAELLQEVEHNEEKIWVVSLEHGHKQLDHVSILHLPFDLKVLGQIEEEMESYKQNFLLLLNDVLNGVIRLRSHNYWFYLQRASFRLF